MKTRVERCETWLKRTNTKGWMFTKRQDQAAWLNDFVLSEKGRVKEVEDSLALVLYFKTIADREEFMAAVAEVKPGMVNRKVP